MDNRIAANLQRILLQAQATGTLTPVKAREIVRGKFPNLELVANISRIGMVFTDKTLNPQAPTSTLFVDYHCLVSENPNPSDIPAITAALMQNVHLRQRTQANLMSIDH